MVVVDAFSGGDSSADCVAKIPSSKLCRSWINSSTSRRWLIAAGSSRDEWSRGKSLSDGGEMGAKPSSCSTRWRSFVVVSSGGLGTGGWSQ